MTSALSDFQLLHVSFHSCLHILTNQHCSLVSGWHINKISAFPNGEIVDQLHKGRIDQLHKGRIDQLHKGRIDQLHKGRIDQLHKGRIDQLHKGRIDQLHKGREGLISCTREGLSSCTREGLISCTREGLSSCTREGLISCTREGLSRQSANVQCPNVISTTVKYALTSALISKTSCLMGKFQNLSLNKYMYNNHILDSTTCRNPESSMLPPDFHYHPPPPPPPNAEVEITVGHRTLSEQIHVLSAQFCPCADNLSEQFFSTWCLHHWVVIYHSVTNQTSVCNLVTHALTSMKT